jgi:hypothetical protein
VNVGAVSGQTLERLAELVRRTSKLTNAELVALTHCFHGQGSDPWDIIATWQTLALTLADRLTASMQRERTKASSAAEPETKSHW